MRTGFESTLLGIELGSLEVKGECSDHYTTEALSVIFKILFFIILFCLQHPSYKNFTGEINRLGNQKYEVLGHAAMLDEKTVEITELPIGTWTQNYKESTLEVMLHGTAKYKGCIT